MFKIKWGSFLPLLKKKQYTEQETKSPIFYFESEIELFVYQSNPGYIVYSSIVIDKDIESFKMEYLPDAIELLEKPSDKSTIVIRQE